MTRSYARRCLPASALLLLTAFGAVWLHGDETATDPPAGERNAAEIETPYLKDDAIARPFREFLTKQDAKSYLAVRETLIASKAYDPYASTLSDVEDLLDEKKFAEARKALVAAMPNLLLSPRAHRFLAEAEAKLGDRAAAERERELAERTLKGLLATGDGSAEKPYLVVSPVDEYDAMESLGRRVASQGLHQKEKRSFDVLIGPDGTETWFDVTAALAKMMAGFGENP